RSEFVATPDGVAGVVAFDCTGKEELFPASDSCAQPGKLPPSLAPLCARLGGKSGGGAGPGGRKGQPAMRPTSGGANPMADHNRRVGGAVAKENAQMQAAVAQEKAKSAIAAANAA